MTDDEYSEHEDIQGMIDRAVERDGPEYVAENIDQLLAGLGVVMNVPPKEELDIPDPDLEGEADDDSPSGG